MTKVEVEKGKYTVVLPDKPEEKLHVLRYGESWRDCAGDKLIYCLASELNEARQKIKELNTELDDCRSELHFLLSLEKS